MPEYSVNMEELRRLCKKFIETMKGARSGSNLESLGNRVCDDMEKYGKLSPLTQKRLSKWCHTEGAQYLPGEPIAREMSKLIYGRVIPREE